MAYSHAWTLVANMNRLAGEELVSRTFGGRHGGKAWLTPAGRIIAQFWGWRASLRNGSRRSRAITVFFFKWLFL
jgi:molybdate transport repressor ModE-like protein